MHRHRRGDTIMDENECSQEAQLIGEEIISNGNFDDRDEEMEISPIEEPISKSIALPKLRVLSLFDGIGTGMYQLTKLGLDIEAFFASEIDEQAMMVTRFHFGDKITHLGSVTDIWSDKLKEIGPINLLIGGSPCNQLSNVNHRKKGLYDFTGTGPLFFEFVRIMNILKILNQKANLPFYWLYENVANMELETKKEISEFLGEPYVIDSYYNSAQRRKRFFWSNIPNIKQLERVKNTNGDIEGPVLQDFLDPNLNRIANVKKIGTITTKRKCLQDGQSKDPVTEDGVKSELYITELEKIFGFTSHYTDVGNLNITKRYRLLGNAWSGQVIKSIFELLTDKFARK